METHNTQVKEMLDLLDSDDEIQNQEKESILNHTDDVSDAFPCGMYDVGSFEAELAIAGRRVIPNVETSVNVKQEQSEPKVIRQRDFDQFRRIKLDQSLRSIYGVDPDQTKKCPSCEHTKTLRMFHLNSDESIITDICKACATGDFEEDFNPKLILQRSLKRETSTERSIRILKAKIAEDSLKTRIQSNI